MTCRGFARAVADCHLNGEETKATLLFRDKHQIGHRKGNVNCHHKNKTAFCVKPYTTSPVFLSGDEEHFIIMFNPPPHTSGLFFLTSSSSLSLIPPPSHCPSPSSYQSLQPRGEIFTSTKTSSLSAFLSESSFSLIIISPGRQIIANRMLSLYLSIFYFTFLPLVGSHLFFLTPRSSATPATDPIMIVFFLFPNFLYGHIMLLSLQPTNDS